MAASATRDFNGSSDNLDSGDGSSYNFTNGTSVSVGCWINSDTASATRAICGNNAVIQGWYFGIIGSNELGIYRNPISPLLSGIGITANEWTYVAMGWTQGTGANFVKISSTGVITTASSSVTSAATSTATTFKIGEQGGGGAWFDGEIAHVQVWNRRLTNDELVLSGFRPGSIGQSLISYWPIYGQRSPETDLGSLQNHATVTGTTASSGAIPLCVALS